MGKDEQQNETKQQARHDPFFRSTFSEPGLFRKWLVWFLPILVELLDLDRMELQKDSRIDEKLKAHYNDLLYKIPIRGTDKNMVVFVLVEHKAGPERWTMLQILRYIVLIWMRELNLAIDEKRFAGFVLPPVLPIIVYHGERNFKATVRLGKLIRPIQGFEKYQLDFEAMLLNLMDFDKTTPPEDLELFAVLAVMQAVFSPDAAERIARIYQKIKHKMGDPRYSGRFVKLLRYMITSSKYFSYDNLNEVQSQMSDTDVATIAPCLESLIAIGLEKGREEERTIWVTDKAETLLRILVKKFGEVPLAISDKLHSIHDIDVLGQLTEFVALDCDSLDDFVKVLEK
jgi:predicted transposase/invertase (TIGR01784 family)